MLLSLVLTKTWKAGIPLCNTLLSSCKFISCQRERFTHTSTHTLKKIAYHNAYAYKQNNLLNEKRARNMNKRNLWKVNISASFLHQTFLNYENKMKKWMNVERAYMDSLEHDHILCSQRMKQPQCSTSAVQYIYTGEADFWLFFSRAMMQNRTKQYKRHLLSFAPFFFFIFVHLASFVFPLLFLSMFGRIIAGSNNQTYDAWGLIASRGEKHERRAEKKSAQIRCHSACLGVHRWKHSTRIDSYRTTQLHQEQETIITHLWSRLPFDKSFRSLYLGYVQTTVCLSDDDGCIRRESVIFRW